ncbi:hypothetical protein [Sorangium sp. So ce233]
MISQRAAAAERRGAALRLALKRRGDTLEKLGGEGLVVDPP